MDQHLRHELPYASIVLSWLGIIGGTITAFSNLQTVLDLATWAKALVDTWNGWLNLLWSFLLLPLDFDIEPHSRFQSTMALAIMSVAVGSYLSAGRTANNNAHCKPGWNNLLRWNFSVAVLGYIALAWFAGHYVGLMQRSDLPEWFWTHYDLLMWSAYAACIFVGLLHWPVVTAIIVTIAAVVFSHVFQLGATGFQPGPRVNEILSMLIGIGLSILSGVVVVLLAPPRAFATRILWLLAGLMVIVVLNYVSRLNLLAGAAVLPA